MSVGLVKSLHNCYNNVSQSSRYLTIEKDVVNTLFTAQAQSDLNKLSAEAAVEHSSISVDKCYDSEIVCTRCSKKGRSLYRL